VERGENGRSYFPALLTTTIQIVIQVRLAGKRGNGLRLAVNQRMEERFEATRMKRFFTSVRRNGRALALLLALGLIGAHESVLAPFGSFLVENGQWNEPADSRVVAVFDEIPDPGFSPIDQLRPGTTLLLMDRPWQPTVQIGARPSVEEMVREALSFPPNSLDLTTVPTTGPTYAHKVQGLRNWLNKHPQETVTVLVERSNGRSACWMLNDALPPELRCNVLVRSLPSRTFNEKSWWKSDDGIKAVVVAYLGLAFEATGEFREPAPVDWDPQQFENNLPRAQSDSPNSFSSPDSPNSPNSPNSPDSPDSPNSFDSSNGISPG